MHRSLLVIVTCHMLLSCNSQNADTSISVVAESEEHSSLIVANGSTPKDRIGTPEGFKRISLSPGSFGDYLRGVALYPPGYKVHYYDGRIKPQDVYVAVLKYDVGKADLQQCADAVMRLRAEYFYQQKNYDSIHFRLTNGFDVPFSKWMQGFRVKINGNDAMWVAGTTSGHDYEAFRKYMDFIFSYAGTLSLDRFLYSKPIDSILPGDVFVQGGSPGHAVLVMDVAENKKGERIFLLAQSYMPAQEIQVLKNFKRPDLSPWFTLKEDEELHTPEWNFPAHSLKRW